MAFALPGAQIRLGAAQLAGLVGTYTSDGSWQALPCDDQGNRLPDPTYDQGGMLTLTGKMHSNTPAVESYPQPMIDAAKNDPTDCSMNLGAFSPNDLSSFPYATGEVSTRIPLSGGVMDAIQLPTGYSGSEARNYIIDASGYTSGQYVVPNSDGTQGAHFADFFTGGVTTDISGTIKAHFKVFGRVVNPLLPTDISGTIKAHFKWFYVDYGNNILTPPDDDTGPPDPNNIALFLADTVTAAASTSYGSSGKTTGLTATATATMTLPVTETATATAPDATANNSGPSQSQTINGRHMVLVPVNSSNGVAELLLNGGLVTNVKNSLVYGVRQQNSYFTVTNGATSATIRASVAGRTAPAHLIAPDALARPDVKKDGSNQYVYDDKKPGHLFVPGIIKVQGTTLDDMKKLLGNNELDCSFDAPLGTPAPYTWIPYAGVTQVHTTLNQTSPSFPYDGPNFVFTGLPTDNDKSSLGDHKVTLLVNGGASEVAHIQTFFLPLASNYTGAYADYNNNNYFPDRGVYALQPDGVTPYGTGDHYWIPNWYHYYDKVYPATGKYKVGSRSWCDPNTATHPIHIENDVFGNGQMPIFTVKRNDPSALVNYAGYLEISGIFKYIAVCAHEKGHQDAWQPQSDTGKAIYTNSSTDDSGDSDGVDDTWEKKHHFDSGTKDTTHAYAGKKLGGDIPDQEVIADIPTLGALLGSLPPSTSVGNKSAWKRDWSSSGLQFGTVTNYAPQSGITPVPGPDLYLTFHPCTGIDPLTKEPIYATTSVKVWTITDLQNNISPSVGGTVLTDLIDLS